MSVSFPNSTYRSFGGCGHCGDCRVCGGELFQYSTWEPNLEFSTLAARHECKGNSNATNNGKRHDFEQNSTVSLRTERQQTQQQVEAAPVANAKFGNQNEVSDCSKSTTLLNVDAAVSALLDNLALINSGVDFLDVERSFDDTSATAGGYSWLPSPHSDSCSSNLNNAPFWCDREYMNSFSTTASVPPQHESMSPMSTTRGSSPSSGTPISPRNLDNDCRLRNFSFNKQLNKLFDLRDLDSKNRGVHSSAPIATTQSAAVTWPQQCVEQRSLQLPRAQTTSDFFPIVREKSCPQEYSSCGKSMKPPPPPPLFARVSEDFNFSSSEPFEVESFSKSYSDDNTTLCGKSLLPDRLAKFETDLSKSFRSAGLRHETDNQKTTITTIERANENMCSSAHGRVDDLLENDVAALTLLSLLAAYDVTGSPKTDFLKMLENNELLGFFNEGRYNAVNDNHNSATNGVVHSRVEGILTQQASNLVNTSAPMCVLGSRYTPAPVSNGSVLEQPNTQVKPAVVDSQRAIKLNSSSSAAYDSVDVCKLLLHEQGRCKPCAFHYNRKKGCRNGPLCDFCHHDDHSKLTLKQWKKQQQRILRVQSRGRGGYGIEMSPALSQALNGKRGAFTNSGVDCNADQHTPPNNASGVQVGTTATMGEQQKPYNGFVATQQHLRRQLPHQQTNNIIGANRRVEHTIDATASLEGCRSSSAATDGNSLLNLPPPPAMPINRLSRVAPPAPLTGPKGITATADTTIHAMDCSAVNTFYSGKGLLPFDMQQKLQSSVRAANSAQKQQQHGVSNTCGRWVWHGSLGVSRRQPPPPPPVPGSMRM
eukprot:Lankesteria_metandrocarpae@DN4750_c0_g1_i1.p1